MIPYYGLILWTGTLYGGIKHVRLKEKGLIFVGLDIIGDRLTEINVTSPTCIREIEAEFPVSITGMLMDAIEARLQQQ